MKNISPITVLMPTFNCSKTISMAIKSILNQSFPDFELLIVDDGSVDNTEQIITYFKDDRIRYVKKHHSGLASSLNYGLKIAKYDWVARMDADDICAPNRLERQLEKGSFRPNTINCTWSSYFRDHKILYTVETPSDQLDLKKKLALHSYICHPSVIYNRNFILAQGGYDCELQRFEDYELWLRLMNNCSFHVVPEYLLFMRIRNNSLSRENIIENRKIVHSIQLPYYESLENNFGITENSNKIIVRGWREYFYGSPSLSRIEWGKDKLHILFDPRIIIAYFISFFPENIVNIFRDKRVRIRLASYLKNFRINKSFLEILSEIAP